MVSAGSGNMYRHVVMALLTYLPSEQMHLIVGNLLLLDVGPWRRAPSPCQHHRRCCDTDFPSKSDTAANTTTEGSTIKPGEAVTFHRLL